MNGVIEFISFWIVNILVLFIIVSIAELVMPKGNMKKYIELVIGILIVFTIISPITRIFDYDFKPSSTIYDYTKEQEKKLKTGDDFYDGQNDQIKSLVIEKMKSEIIHLIEDENIGEVHDISIGLEITDDSHEINYINIIIGEEVKKSDISINKVSNKIPKINLDEELSSSTDAETNEYSGLKEKIAEAFSLNRDIVSIKTIEKRDLQDERDN